MTEFYWNKPLFILGNPRSGTSLLRLMLHSHSQICIPPESHFFLWLEEKYGEWNDKNLAGYIHDIYASTKFETWNLDRIELKYYLERALIQNYAHLNSLIYQFFGLNNHKNPLYWGDKNSLWIDKLPQIEHHYPDVQIVHVIRDGRDVACSYKEINRKNVDSPYAPRLPENMADIAKLWDENNRSIEQFLRTLSNGQFVQIKYEDLVTAPETELQRILALLDLNFEEQQLEYYLKDRPDIEPEEFLNWKEKLLQPPDKNNIGKFQKLLSQSEIDIFNTIGHHSLTNYGYL